MVFILDTDTDNSHIFNHKGGIQLVSNNNNNYGAQLPANYQHDPFLNKPAFETPQQWPHARNDWPHLQEEYNNPANKGEKEETDLKHSVKKQHKEKESSEEYTDSDDQEETTEAPKKVLIFSINGVINLGKSQKS
jgi:hypothetical protein